MATDFIPFATGNNANVQSQAAYAGDGTTAVGFQQGIAPSAKFNKALRQATFVAAGVATFISNTIGVNVLDDGNLTGFTANLLAAIRAAAASSSLVQGTTGGTTTYGTGNSNYLIVRDNGGVVMIDTLPGAAAGAMPAGWSVSISNKDNGALVYIVVGAGSTLDNVASGYIVLGPKQSITVRSDGTNYFTSARHGRTRLQAAWVFFVATTGSDATGLGTLAAPWLTIQFGHSWIVANLDCAGQMVTFQLADGTYSSVILEGQVPGSWENPALNAPNILILGNNATPSNVIIQGTSAHAIKISGTLIRISGFRIQTTGTAADGNPAVGLLGMGGARIYYDNLVFGTCSGEHINAQDGSIITITNYVQGSGTAQISIVGGATVHIRAQHTGHIKIGRSTITLTGTPTFSTAFAQTHNIGQIVAPSSLVTFSGGAIGQRHNAHTNGVMDTNGGGTSFFPGSTAGTTNGGAGYFY
jgi:hypothetical protein